MPRGSAPTAVEQAALEQQAAISRDPVETLRLRLALVRFLEEHKQAAAAEKIVAQLERDNPAILGIVRAAADFYWRNKMPGRSVDVLTRAAGRANEDLRKDFALEAARKATEAHEFDRARSIVGSAAGGRSFRRALPRRHGRHLRAGRRQPAFARFLQDHHRCHAQRAARSGRSQCPGRGTAPRADRGAHASGRSCRRGGSVRSHHRPLPRRPGTHPRSRRLCRAT